MMFRVHGSMLNLLIALTLPFIGMNCGSTCKILKEPDPAQFKHIVASKNLQDSLAAGKIVLGMPYFIVSEIFPNCAAYRLKTQVACIGCRQRVDDSEGFGRHFSTPDLQIYYDEYKTDSGILAVWYQCTDFYSKKVSTGDALWLYPKIGGGGDVFVSKIKCLKNPTTIQLENKIPDALKSDTLYGEVYYSEESSNSSSRVSYWYLLNDTLKGVVDTMNTTIRLKTPNFLYYPIEHIELNGDPRPSFHWRKPK